MKNGKQSYIQLATEHFPIWCQPWFLDAISGGKWDCRYQLDKEQISAVWIYGETKKLGFRSMNFPTFMKYNGPFFASFVSTDNYNEIAIQLYSTLPNFIKMDMEFQPDIQQNLTGLIEIFDKKAFAQRLRQTYVWDISVSKEELLSAMDGNYRRMINKQNENCSLKVASKSEAMEMSNFHAEWVDDLNNHGVSDLNFKETIDVIYTHNAGKVFELQYENEKIASVLLVHDKTKAYYLLAVNNKSYNKVYPSVLMSYEIACYLKEEGITAIDFLGSDIDAIARVWRKLGAERKEYLYMNKKVTTPF